MCQHCLGVVVYGLSESKTTSNSINQSINQSINHLCRDNNPSNWEVILATHDLHQAEKHRIIRGLSRLIYHERFDMKTFDYDVALLKLSQPVAPSRYTQPVCLPEQGRDPQVPAMCMATGWGNPGGWYYFGTRSRYLRHGYVITYHGILWYLLIAPKSTYTRVTLYTAGHLHTAVPHCSHSRAPIVHTALPRENNEHDCVYLRCMLCASCPAV